MTLQARSCPTCRSIGPRRVVAGNSTADVLCSDLWHEPEDELRRRDDAAVPEDLDDIRTKWLRFCAHDTGLPYACICPQEDHRPVIAALVTEVEQLRHERDEAVAGLLIYETEVGSLNRTIDTLAAEHAAHAKMREQRATWHTMWQEARTEREEAREGWEYARDALRRYDRAWIELKAEQDLTRPVVEAAKQWAAAVKDPMDREPWDAAPESHALVAAVDQMDAETPNHVYISTACHHERHDRCGKMQADRGEVGPPHCKFCAAVCACPVCNHTDPHAAQLAKPDYVPGPKASPECMAGGGLHEACDNDLGCTCSCHTEVRHDASSH